VNAVIVVFGREPVPGRTKTRLARAIGAERAAAVSRALLERALTEAAATGVPVVLSLAAPLTGVWSPPGGVAVEVQCDGDLGRRMGDAFSRRFAAGAERVLLVGSDCPGTDAGRLGAALRLLDTHPVVLGPARDGGYWAIGQRAPGVDCFTGVPWSSPETLRATRERLRGLGVPWAETVTLADVDTVEDLERLQREGPGSR